MKIIGLTGKSTIGRNFVADYLVHRGFVCIECLSPMDAILESLRSANIQRDELESAIRHFSPMAFCLELQSIIKNYATLTDLIVVPDARHETEANWIRQNGFLWHVQWNDDADLFRKDEIEPIVSDHGTPDMIHQVIDDLLISQLGIKASASVGERILRCA